MVDVGHELWRRCGALLPVLFAAAVVLAPWAHEAAHDHRHDGVAKAHVGGFACHADHHAPVNPASPAAPTDQHDDDSDGSAPGNCWLTVQLHGLDLPPAPAAVVFTVDTAATTLAPPTRRVVFGGFDHSITLRGPPASLDLA